MAVTATWTWFGEVITEAPHLTLLAFLGHQPSIAAANERDLVFPKMADFQDDPAYNPNPQGLDLEEEILASKSFLMGIATWGAEPLKRAVNACSLLQCVHHSACVPKLKDLRNEAAFLLHELVDGHSTSRRSKAEEVRRRCSEEYRLQESARDSAGATTSWYHLGAPWFGLETVLGNLAARSDCGENEPGPANSSWIARNTVWPERALDAAAHWSSFSLVRDVIRSSLIAWGTEHPPAA